MRDRFVDRAATIGVAVLVLAACGPAGELPLRERESNPQPAVAPEAADPAPSLSAERALERTIAPGEKHDYWLELAAGELLELTVEQQGVDLVLRLFDPSGELTLEADLPIADLGPEQLLAVAEHSGSHRVEIEAWEAETGPGSYLAGPLVRRPATAGDRLRAAAAAKFWHAEMSAWARDWQRAIGTYEEALELWRRGGDRFWEAETLDRLGDVHDHRGDREAAIEAHRRAAAVLATLDVPRFRAITTYHLASLYSRAGELEPAKRLAELSVELRRGVADRRGEALGLSLLADILKIEGETQEALDRFGHALELLDRPRDRLYRAAVLHNLGTLYRRLGQREAALQRLAAAEKTFAEVGENRQRAASLSQIAELTYELGDAERALEILGVALELRRQTGDARGEAVVLRKIGSLMLREGDLAAARRHLLDALALLAESDAPRSRAALLNELGRLHIALGRTDEASGYHRSALEILERVGDPLGRVESLFGVAIAERRRDRLEVARTAAARALEITESLRIKPYSEELRLSYFSTAQDYFAFYLDLLMELEQRQPGVGHAAAALEVSERARARSLLDLLSDAGARLRDRAAPELLAREQTLQERISGAVLRLDSELASEAERETASEKLTLALAELEELRAEIRRQSPRYAALTQPRTLSTSEIQTSVLDGDTVLVEYWLGSERSFAWLVDGGRLESFQLPPAAEIEAGVRELLSLLGRGPRRQSEGRLRALLCLLGRQLLTPLAGRLDGQRLAIVADGALQYLPFAALPDPGAPGGCLEAPPLVAAHEIVFLPSASTLALSRRERAGRRPAAGLVAVLADPVFSDDDQRLAASPPPAGRPAADPAQPGGGGWRRLPQSRREAAAIVELGPPGSVWAALDFDASKQAVLSGRLAGFQVVHFATHGVLDTESPQLSGLVLSQRDRRGRPIDGRLRVHEIYNLKLPAELVVLSGCQTALGQQVRGEGMLGLTRGFLYAGAARLAVSLWEVSDRGAAELMVALYRAMLEQSLAPAAALRAAQLEVRRRRPHPFYWAGFVLQGDWRPVWDAHDALGLQSRRRAAAPGGNLDGGPDERRRALLPVRPTPGALPSAG